MAEIRRLPCWRWGWMGICVWALATPVRAQQARIPMNFGDVEITLVGMPQGSAGHGYSEYIFRIRNQSAERPHTVSLSLPFEKMYVRGDSIGELRRTVQVGANETVRLSLLQPDHPPIGGHTVAVVVDGQRSDRGMSLQPTTSTFSSVASRRGYRYYSPSYGGGTERPLLRIGSRVKPMPKRVESTILGVGAFPPALGMAGGVGGPGGPPPGGAPMGSPPGFPGGAAPGNAKEMAETEPEDAVPVLGNFIGLADAFDLRQVKLLPVELGLPPESYQPVDAEPVEMWSSNWLGYTRYDGIVVTAAELTAMPAGVRSALWQYVETGGFLLVLGPVEPRGLSAVLEIKTDADGWKSISAGLGTCLIAPDDNYSKWRGGTFEKLATQWKATHSLWEGGRRTTIDAHQEFPVVEDLGVPVKSLFALMFLFTLAIGPINFLVLTRMNRRIWLLWTTPAISLATCVAVFGFMIASEGWEGRLRIETFTFLDESTHRAITVGWTGVYTPLTPADGLHFSYDTEVIPQRVFEDYNDQSRSCTIDWTQDQHFASGWVEARVPAIFRVRKSELRRERITLRPDTDGSWIMKNFLPVDVRRFSYVDEKWQLHQAENVAAGAEAKLKQSEKEGIVAIANMANPLSSSGWKNNMDQLAANPQRYLRPGTYLAEVDDSPFLENCLRNARQRKAHALIVGIRPKSE
jgi:hypothetical protein